MIPALRRLVVASVLLGLLLPAALPLATAEHAFSHRYIVYGRLIDANGDPIPEARVNVNVPDSVGAANLCAPQPNTETDAWGATETNPTTNAYGEFFYCFHAHSISRGVRGDVVAEYEGTEVTQAVDPFIRKNFIVLQTSDESGTPTDEFESTYLVSGRVWYSGQTRVEGVGVYANTLNFENLTVTFRTADGERITEETSTNGYGDFAVRVPVEDVQGGRITVEVAGKTFTSNADPEVRASELSLEVPDPDNTLMTVLKVIGGLIIAGLVVGGGAYAWKKTSEQREIAAARERSTRKRANR